MTFLVHPTLRTVSVRTNLAEVDNNHLFEAQKPYRNGVTVYRKSVWMGNGFGNAVARIAVQDGVVVGVYESEMYHQVARTAGSAEEIYSDKGVHGRGHTLRTYTKKTALSKWTAAIKALQFTDDGGLISRPTGSSP
ncbi:hypothetical protein H8Z59_24400 [Mycolicibacterium fortuitum]|uniref:hypothetical protein n=1 Tax=Mycolicibacterium fortuitum TaxID=1766 RepID=UPI001CDC2607|nr:hypothetical protein [Mycolicibacterium fortuitum]UBV20380.1 hypothetical protein H8Z59_24400 [Mycolicibacterium fortuitum]